VRRIAGIAAIFAGLGAVSLSGCGTDSTTPLTFRVDGKVVRNDNTPYTGGGHIEFRNTANPQHTSLGQIGEDGSFTLKTIAGSRSLDGAQEGEHRVTVTPAGDGQKTRAMQLKKRYAIVAGETNTIVVRLEQ
jgi:hypothetical protein